MHAQHFLARLTWKRIQFFRRLLQNDSRGAVEHFSEGLPMAVLCEANARVRFEPLRHGDPAGEATTGDEAGTQWNPSIVDSMSLGDKDNRSLRGHLRRRSHRRHDNISQVRIAHHAIAAARANSMVVTHDRFYNLLESIRLDSDNG